MKIFWKRLKKNEHGFTLIELLAVVAILGILATIALPRVMSAITNSKSGKGSADIKTIESSLEQFFLKYGRYPLNLKMLVAQGFLKQDFIFMNGYNNLYFYAVNWDGVASTNATKYVLGDPGQTSGALADLYTANALPTGLDPTAAGASAYYWGAVAAPATIADAQIDYYDSGTKVNLIGAGTITLTAVGAIPAAEPTNAKLKKP
ncbi:MAG TPA: prepilin-type N-terminal cleavage/methylation domain-containing protein [Bacillota bacterium]|jgi:type II secretion system protein G